MTYRNLATAIFSLHLAACLPQDYSEAELARARAAIPELAEMQAASPSEAPQTFQVFGAESQIATDVRSIVTGVNGTVSSMITVLRDVTQTPPTYFRNDEFVWGPLPNQDGAGNYAIYIRDNGPDSAADFRYWFAAVRVMDSDLDGGSNIIWGGTNYDKGAGTRSGVMVFDFEADHNFNSANDSTYDPLGAVTRGRFVAIHSKGPDAADPTAELHMVAAAFRNFKPGEMPDESPVDADYLYGRYATTEHVFRFVEVEGRADFDQDQDALVETGRYRVAMFDDFRGRGEATFSGGSLGPDDAHLVECWDGQSLIVYESAQIGQQAPSTDGVVNDCGLVLRNEIDTLNVPAYSDIPQDVRDDLDHVASTGEWPATP